MNLSVLDWVSIILLLAMMIACTVGVFHPDIDDSANQRWGMVLTFFGSMGQVHAIWEDVLVQTPIYLIMIGVTMFALATVYRIVKRRRLTWF